PLDREFVLLRQEVELRLIAVGHRQLASWRLVLQDIDRFSGLAARLGIAAEEPVEARLPAKVIAHGETIAEAAANSRGLEAVRQRLLVPVDEVALVRKRFEE